MTTTIYTVTRDGSGMYTQHTNKRDAMQFARHIVAKGDARWSRVHRGLPSDSRDALAGWNRDERGRCVRVTI